MTDKIILAGNPNVGKSTLFNRLTGLKQHTGNWAGKTVGSALGFFESGGRRKVLIDTPGTYSLYPSSPDEELARDTICSEECDLIIVVCDGCALERGMYLALQIIERRSNIVLCVNLMDQAKKKDINIDIPLLSEKLGIPVVGISASTGSGIEELLNTIEHLRYENSAKLNTTKNSLELKNISRVICKDVIRIDKADNGINLLDRLLSHKFLSWPIMLGLFLFVLWLSISGANYPSELLSRLFSVLGLYLDRAAKYIAFPPLLSSAIIDGIYGTTAWVVSVMLPPMAIFFPLFTLLEDWGLLPRIAFNMDGIFKKCGSCGKQALCMCMGLGCNAVGVTGCRIIADRREKLISMLTNSFMPCNGRFPTLMLLAGLLLPGSDGLAAALLVLSVIVIGVIATFITSWLLSLCLPKGKNVPFCLELPPYRKPRICETLLRSVFDRTLVVLARAIKTAAPAGLIIWLLANIRISGSSILSHLEVFFDPAGQFFGLDGAILLGFILGLPANEIVLPIIMMCYLSGNSLAQLPSAGEMSVIFSNTGWSSATVICLMIFTLLHWPCATTLITIKKESGKLRYALAAAALPTMWGLLICLLIRMLFR